MLKLNMITYLVQTWLTESLYQRECTRLEREKDLLSGETKYAKNIFFSDLAIPNLYSLNKQVIRPITAVNFIEHIYFIELCVNHILLKISLQGWPFLDHL